MRLLLLALLLNNSLFKSKWVRSALLQSYTAAGSLRFNQTIKSRSSILPTSHSERFQSKMSKMGLYKSFLQLMLFLSHKAESWPQTELLKSNLELIRKTLESCIMGGVGPIQLHIAETSVYIRAEWFRLYPFLSFSHHALVRFPAVLECLLQCHVTVKTAANKGLPSRSLRERRESSTLVARRAFTHTHAGSLACRFVCAFSSSFFWRRGCAFLCVCVIHVLWRGF